MALKNKTRTTITLEIDKGKIIKVTTSDGSKSRNVSSTEIARLYQRGKGRRAVQASARLIAAAESTAPCFAYISLGGKWLKIPVPC
jgi:hypothetical protein